MEERLNQFKGDIYRLKHRKCQVFYQGSWRQLCCGQYSVSVLKLFTVPFNYFSLKKKSYRLSFVLLRGTSSFCVASSEPFRCKVQAGRYGSVLLHQTGWLGHHLLYNTSKSTALACHCIAAGAGRLHVMFLDKSSQPVHRLSAY